MLKFETTGQSQGRTNGDELSKALRGIDTHLAETTQLLRTFQREIRDRQ